MLQTGLSNEVFVALWHVAKLCPAGRIYFSDDPALTPASALGSSILLCSHIVLEIVLETLAVRCLNADISSTKIS